MTRFLRRTKAVAHKEVLHIIRDARAVYMALGLPVVMLMLSIGSIWTATLNRRAMHNALSDSLTVP